MMKMDLQRFLNAMNDLSSKERANYHLTLGDLVERLAAADPSFPVIYDWVEQAAPSAPESYRGYYSDLSFPPASTPITAAELLRDAKDAIGSTFEGYKGGDFTMGADTPLWASPHGSANGIAIMDAKTFDGRVVLITKHTD
jgi:hypothetical protein